MGVLQIIILVVSAAMLAANLFVLHSVYGQRNQTKGPTGPNNDNGRSVKNNDDECFHIVRLDNLDEEYMNLFSNPPMDKAARRGKSAYLRDAYHERIRQIVNALNIEGVNISSYVDMVLTDHLMRYETQIDRLLQNYYKDTLKQYGKCQLS